MPFSFLVTYSDLADWLGVEDIGLFNFKPSVRPVPLEVHIQVSYPVLCSLWFCMPTLQYSAWMQLCRSNEMLKKGVMIMRVGV